MPSKKENTNLLTMYSNTYNFENAIASTLFLPQNSFKDFKPTDKIEELDFLILRESLEAINPKQIKNLVEKNIHPALIAFDKNALTDFFNKNEFIKIKSKKYGTLYLFPFIPIEFVKNVYFADEEILDNFLTTKFHNLNKESSQFSMQAKSELFKTSKELIFAQEDLDGYENKIAHSRSQQFDSIIGGIQSVLYLTKKKKDNVDLEEIFNLIDEIILSNTSSSKSNWFDFNIGETLKDGLKSIQSNDPLNIKIFKVALIRLSSLDSVNRPISLPIIEEIFDSIPRVLLTEKDEAEIDKFISLCENLVAGNVELSENFYLDDKDAWCSKAIIFLLTQSGENQLADFIEYSESFKIPFRTMIAAFLLYGLYTNYSGISIAFKGLPEHQKTISILSKLLLLGRGTFSYKQNLDPGGTAHWWDLYVDNYIFEQIDAADPFLTSISAQAKEAGFDFKRIRPDELVLRARGENESDLTLKAMPDDFFSIETDSVISSKSKKATKAMIVSLLKLVSSENMRSSLVVDKFELKLKQFQLSSTLDIDEIKHMIIGLRADWKKLADHIKES